MAEDAAGAEGGSRLVFLRSGAFSGSAPALLAELRAQADPGVEIVDTDIMPLARSPLLAWARMRAHAEARGAGTGVPWTKTSAWTGAVQRRLTRHGLIAPGVPLVVVQTLPAPVPPPGVPYVVYTDRVGLEGAAVGGAHRSRWSAGWLARERELLGGARRVLVMGPSTREILVDAYGLGPDGVRVVGAGVNAPPQAGTVVRNPGEGLRLLFVGTQWDLKGGPELLRAFGKLHGENPQWRLALAGSAPEGPLPDGVVAYGRVPHASMDAAYAGADAVVIPTHMEAFGIALVEALTRGLPVVASTVGNQPWIVGDAGLLVPPGNAGALEAALRGLHGAYASFHERACRRGELLRRSMTWSGVARAVLEELVV